MAALRRRPSVYTALEHLRNRPRRSAQSLRCSVFHDPADGEIQYGRWSRWPLSRCLRKQILRVRHWIILPARPAPKQIKNCLPFAKSRMANRSVQLFEHKSPEHVMSIANVQDEIATRSTGCGLNWQEGASGCRLDAANHIQNIVAEPRTGTIRDCSSARLPRKLERHLRIRIIVGFPHWLPREARNNSGVIARSANSCFIYVN